MSYGFLRVYLEGRFYPHSPDRGYTNQSGFQTKFKCFQSKNEYYLNIFNSDRAFDGCFCGFNSVRGKFKKI